MRILHIPHAYAPVVGGAEIHCQRLSETLVEKGHLVRVVTTNVGNIEAYYKLGEPSAGVESEILNRVEVRRFSFCGGFYKAMSTLMSGLPHDRLRQRMAAKTLNALRNRFLNYLEQQVKEFRPDVVMTMPHLVANVECVLRLHSATPFPLVMVPLLHDTWPDELKQRMRLALRQADAVVANTSVEANSLQNDYGVPAEKVFVGWLGVDLPQTVTDQNRKPQVLFLGRKVPEKGIQNLLHAMRLVWKISPKAQLILAGARAPRTAEVDNMIAALPENERGRVVSLDNISEEKKTDLLATCCCLALPSPNESFGIVLLEAMAHRTPVITLDRPVFHDVVDEGVNGILVAPDDPQQMANAILRLLATPTVARAMGERGYAKVQERFTWERVAINYLQAYDHAIASHGKPRDRVTQVSDNSPRHMLTTR